MGYDIHYDGHFAITPPLAAADRVYLAAFCRRTSVRCGWRVAEARDVLEWDGQEKFTTAAESLAALIASFFVPWGYALDGIVHWEGEDGATGTICVANNQIDANADDDDAPLDDEVRSWIAALGGADRKMRVIAARELGCAKYASDAARREAIDALANALTETDVAVRALETLGGFGAEASPTLERVIPQLASTSAFVRYWATFALARMGPAAKVAIPAITLLLKDTADGPRYGAIDALKRLT